MRKLVFITVAAVAAMAIHVSAETISIHLPQLENRWMPSDFLSVPFNLGRTFSYIGQARIKYVGTFYPGRAYKWWNPPTQWYYVGNSIHSKMDPQASEAYWRANGPHYSSQTAFADEINFTWYKPGGTGGSPTWLFLLDGQGQVDAALPGLACVDCIFLEFPEAYINEAILTIEEQIRQNNPNGGESLVSGTVKTISWTDFRGTGNYNIVYSTDNGANWIPVDSVSGKSSYDWIVPMVDSNNCRVRVIDDANSGIYDTSDTQFSIHRLNYDLTGDLCYDFNDFAVLASYWMDNTCSSSGWCGGADFDHSGTVDSLDAATFTRYWLEEL